MCLFGILQFYSCCIRNYFLSFSFLPSFPYFLCSDKSDVIHKDLTEFYTNPFFSLRTLRVGRGWRNFYICNKNLEITLIPLSTVPVTQEFRSRRPQGTHIDQEGLGPGPVSAPSLILRGLRRPAQGPWCPLLNAGPLLEFTPGPLLVVLHPFLSPLSSPLGAPRGSTRQKIQKLQK